MSDAQDWRLKVELADGVDRGGTLDRLLGHLRGGGGPDLVHELSDAVPHDVVLTHDGKLLFAYATDGSVRVVADGFVYCNGIAVDRDGLLVVVEGRGLQRLLPDGSREWVIEKLGRGGGDRGHPVRVAERLMHIRAEPIGGG